MGDRWVHVGRNTHLDLCAVGCCRPDRVTNCDCLASFEIQANRLVAAVAATDVAAAAVVAADVAGDGGDESAAASPVA